MDIRGHVPRLYEHLAAADLAVVQGGLTTTMELTASRRPFVYVPLRHHFEQTSHVRHRLDRYGAGRCLDYAEAVDPDALAEAVVKEVGPRGVPPTGRVRRGRRGRPDARRASLAAVAALSYGMCWAPSTRPRRHHR